MRRLTDGVGDGVGLRKDCVFELGLVGAEGVGSGNTFNGRVQLIEKFLSDTRGDFGAVAPTEHVFVSNDDAMGFADSGSDGFPIVRRERAQIDNFDGDAFTLESSGGDFGAVDDGAKRNDADLRSLL